MSVQALRSRYARHPGVMPSVRPTATASTGQIDQLVLERLDRMLAQIGLDGPARREVLLQDDYLIGYLVGMTNATSRDSGLADSVDGLAVACRVLAGLLGRSADTLALARQRVSTARSTRPFQEGLADGGTDTWR